MIFLSKVTLSESEVFLLWLLYIKLHIHTHTHIQTHIPSTLALPVLHSCYQFLISTSHPCFIYHLLTYHSLLIYFVYCFSLPTPPFPLNLKLSEEFLSLLFSDISPAPGTMPDPWQMFHKYLLKEQQNNVYSIDNQLTRISNLYK